MTSTESVAVRCSLYTFDNGSMTAASLAQGSMSDVQQHLGALLGREVKQLRTTDEDPPCISVIDVVGAITGQAKNPPTFRS